MAHWRGLSRGFGVGDADGGPSPPPPIVGGWLMPGSSRGRCGTPGPLAGLGGDGHGGWWWGRRLRVLTLRPLTPLASRLRGWASLVAAHGRFALSVRGFERSGGAEGVVGVLGSPALAGGERRELGSS